MINNNFIQNGVDSNKAMYQKMKAQMNSCPAYSAYNKNNVVYYNDEKKIKKNKLKKALTLAFVAIGGLSIAGIAIFKNPTRATKIIKGTQQASNKAFGAFDCLATNFTNVKDDLWDRFAKFLKSKKIGFVDLGGQKISNVYRKFVHNPNVVSDYNKAAQKLKDLGIDGVCDNFDEFFNKTNDTIRASLDNLSKNNERVTQGIFSPKKFIKHPIAISKDFLGQVTSTKLADDKLADAFKKIGAIVKIPDGASSETVKAINEYNKVALNIQNKIRDINIGSAPTDILGILGSVGILGATLALEDDKQERKSIVLNLGIPIIGAMTTAMIATANCVSGGLGMLLGLAIGEAASITVKAIDSVAHKKKDDTNNKQWNA